MKKHERYWILIIIIIVTPFIGWTQSIHGVVVDKKMNPIPDALVVESGSKLHKHTDNSGVFVLDDIEIGDTLIISHLSFDIRLWVVENIDADLVIILDERVFELSDIVITQSVRSINIVSKIDLETAPYKSSQEVLRKVPGLIIGQHAGGGKAEQIFLRGFDIDHGTDVNLSVDGLPVNMVSHAHGQGYADLHFLIPEVIDEIDFGKGPYYADKGNFTTAGYVDFSSKHSLDESLVQLEYGQHNTFRTLGMFDIVNNDKHAAYLASEYLLSDGFFESSQNFHRINLFAKYTTQLDENDKLTLLASHFTSKWDASGQIPQRAVENGTITRFGAIDDTEGGQTSRTNLKLDYNKYLNSKSFIRNSVFFTHYDFELYSNFTFFLNDPVNGDQIRQKEDRNIFGVSSEWNYSLPNDNHLIQVGISLRKDEINDNELSSTADRTSTLTQRQLGDVNETNISAYVNTEWNLGKWLINPAIRLDYFKFNYYDQLANSYATQSSSKSLISPKLNFIRSFSKELQTYVKTGLGFHSNDTRVVVAGQYEDILPAAYGVDLGVIWKPIPRLVINGALWYLFLEQEFVYVGDEGIVEPSGKTERYGLDFGLRYQLTDWLFADADFNYSLANSVEEPEGADYIPLAPKYTSSGGLAIHHPSGFYGSFRYRFIGDRPANEFNTLIAEGYLITDMNLGFKWKQLDMGINIDNLFNSEWNETQFSTQSRLENEMGSTEEIHFTPGTPFFIKGIVKYRF
jgi:hypothetical protein